ncbi:MAG: methylenetetrahydrofolate reductase C-terminal domain-containing protein [Thermacetogeniaceae bacterium]
MIVAEGKPVEKILEMVAPFKKVLIAGCRGCVTVCLTGGEKEVGILASQIRMARSKDGNPIEILEQTEERQCDVEYNAKFLENVEQVDAIVSLACGIGIQYLGEKYPSTPIFPGVNTLMLGANIDVGKWEERCMACGDCVLDKTGGICPITRCSKSLLNGPCGGSQNGVCEVSKDVPCGWQLIYDRLSEIGQLDKMREIIPAKNWLRAKGPRTYVREDLTLDRS